ncbi:MAG: LD-carboxypeptidase [Planctomycetes bacterium]|nr:LD-carboxypeptidase [Planctomycetota bacterium]
MKDRSRQPDRVHLMAHASPIVNDLKHLKFADTAEYLGFIRQNLPQPLRLTCAARLLVAEENEQRGGRRDDAARVRDLQNALDDPQTLAIVAARGGAYLSRLLPDLDFSALTKRETPLWVLGFSELTTLVNIVAGYRGGRGLYWLCPDYLGWKIRPLSAGLAAFAEFWQSLPTLLDNRQPPATRYLDLSPISGRLVSGVVEPGRVRVIGGCLSVLAAVLAGSWFRRLRPTNRWLALEDINEPPYRVDRHLAALKVAGWFDKIAGVLIGDFHGDTDDAQSEVLELLRYHLPRSRRLPIVVTRSFGHVWPMTPLPINQPLALAQRGRTVTFTGRIHRRG